MAPSSAAENPTISVVDIALDEKKIPRFHTTYPSMRSSLFGFIELILLIC